MANNRLGSPRRRSPTPPPVRTGMGGAAYLERLKLMNTLARQARSPSPLSSQSSQASQSLSSQMSQRYEPDFASMYIVDALPPPYSSFDRPIPPQLSPGYIQPQDLSLSSPQHTEVNILSAKTVPGYFQGRPSTATTTSTTSTRKVAAAPRTISNYLPTPPTS